MWATQQSLLESERLMTIPLVDLHAQYLSIKEEVDTAIRRVIEESAFIGGRFVREFEEAFAADYGVKHCVSVANGTDAIYIALKMLGIGAGHEVITTAHSWISTSEAISQTGARPVFVDVDEFYALNADLIEREITSATRAIIPVHLYGQPADMAKIMTLARKYELHVVEDCAQSHYATWGGQRVGTFGKAGTFSFYPGKNLGAYGDAGAIVTNDDDLAVHMRMYANHGALRKHFHEMEGINSRLDGLQAAILSVKLKYIHQWTALRQEIASWYDELLSDAWNVATPKVRDGSTHVYHLYVIQVERRDSVAAYLARNGIQTAVHYPVVLPLMEAYRYLNVCRDKFPQAIENAARILSLPMFPELSRPVVEKIATTLSNR